MLILLHKFQLNNHNLVNHISKYNEIESVVKDTCIDKVHKRHITAFNFLIIF